MRPPADPHYRRRFHAEIIEFCFAWLRGASERVWRHHDGGTPMRKPVDNSKALAAFVALKTEFDNQQAVIEVEELLFRGRSWRGSLR
jgi:hypothetical protein